MNAIGMMVGMKPGDTVLAVDEKEVGSLSDFYRRVWAIGKAGVQIPFSILQGNKIRDVKVHSIDRHQRSISRPKKEINI